MINEHWLVVPGLAGVEASSCGRIRILPKMVVLPNGGIAPKGGKPRRGTLVNGRYRIRIFGKNYKVARLVCAAFHGAAPTPTSVCMHKDEDAANDSPDNLACGTQRENLSAPGFKRYCRSRTGASSPRTKWAASRRRAA